MEIEDLGELFSEETRRKVQRRLVTADIPITSERYLGYILIVFLFIFLVLLPVSPILSVLVSMLVLSLSLYLPIYLAHLRSRKAEQELPFFLKSLSTLLRSGIDPLTALRLSSKGTTVLEKSIQKVLNLHDKGTSLRKAFDREGNTYTSERLVRTFNLLGEIIEGGYGIESLERYADSLLYSKKIEVRDFSNKLALYTLLFIAITAIAPSILLMYSLLLPVVFGTVVSSATLYFLLFFVIPLLTILTLAYIGSRSIA